MAVIKQKLLRKNTSGSYDTIHLETGGDSVIIGDKSLADVLTLFPKMPNADVEVSSALLFDNGGNNNIGDYLPGSELFFATDKYTDPGSKGCFISDSVYKSKILNRTTPLSRDEYSNLGENCTNENTTITLTFRKAGNYVSGSFRVATKYSSSGSQYILNKDMNSSLLRCVLVVPYGHPLEPAITISNSYINNGTYKLTLTHYISGYGTGSVYKKWLKRISSSPIQYEVVDIPGISPNPIGSFNSISKTGIGWTINWIIGLGSQGYDCITDYGAYFTHSFQYLSANDKELGIRFNQN